MALPETHGKIKHSKCLASALPWAHGTLRPWCQGPFGPWGQGPLDGRRRAHEHQAHGPCPMGTWAHSMGLLRLYYPSICLYYPLLWPSKDEKLEGTLLAK